MLEYTEKRRLRSVLYALPTIVVLFLLTALVGHAAWGMYGSYREASVRRDKAQAELRVLQARAADLERDIARLSSDRGIEAEIRERYMVAKEGEKVMIITDEEGGDDRTAPPEERSFWQRLLAAVGLE